MPGWQNEPAHGATGGWLWVCLSRSVSLSLSPSLCVSLSLPLSIHLSSSAYQSIHLSIYFSIYPFLCLSLYLSTYLSTYLSVYLSICLSLYQYLSISLSIHPSKAACAFSISEHPKVERTCCVFRCFEHVDFQMCFAPKCGALFQHPTFQECSERGALQMLTSKCASRHNGVHFLSSSSDKSAPNPQCFKHVRFQHASRHNTVHLFNSGTSKSAPTLVCFARFDF